MDSTTPRMQRALLFDRAIEVFEAESLVRVRPQRWAVLFTSAILAAPPLAILFTTWFRHYRLSINGVLFVGPFLLIAIFIAAAALSPKNRLVELDLARRVVRIGGPFGGQVIEAPLKSSTLLYRERERRTGLRVALTGEVWCALPGLAPLRVLSLANGYESIAQLLVDSVCRALTVPPLQPLSTLGATIAAAGNRAAKGPLFGALLAAISATLFLWAYW